MVLARPRRIQQPLAAISTTAAEAVRRIWLGLSSEATYDHVANVGRRG